MTDLPRITVVTPSYNQGRYLEGTIRSIVEQDYPHLEYMVMDGGSTDGSVAIIERYAEHLAHWQSGPDGGQAAAVMEGFRRGTGAVLAWVNSDDALLPGCLRAVGETFAAERELHFVTGHNLVIDEIHGRRFPYYAIVPRFDMLLYGGTHRGFAQTSSFWKRDVFFETGGFDTSLRFCFDYDMYLRMMRLRPGRVVDRFLAVVRLHEGTKTHTLDDVRLVENERIIRKNGYYAMPAWRRWIVRRVLRRRKHAERRRLERRGAAAVPEVPPYLLAEEGGAYG